MSGKHVIVIEEGRSDGRPRSSAFFHNMCPNACVGVDGKEAPLRLAYEQSREGERHFIRCARCMTILLTISVRS